MQQCHDHILPPFLALYAKGSHIQDVQVLTPRVMQWSVEGVWILDLRTCLSFWAAKASALGIDAMTLMRKLLQSQFSRKGLDESAIGETARYYGVFAVDPWQAILMLNHARERKLDGLINLSSAFAGGFSRELSWCAWWQSTVSIMDHFVAAKRKGFSSATFQSQCGQMQRTIESLGIANPWSLKQAEALAVGRRFGTVLRDLWQWTWYKKEHDISVGLPQHGEYLFDSGFPWRSFLLAELPTVSRHLDDPLWEWDFLEPLLQEDLGRICDLDSWDSREGVVRLEWRVVSYDMTVLNIPVCFRHPHSLASERNSCFKTTTLQAHYSFNQAVKNAATVSEGEGLITPPSPIVSWQLIISERLRLSDKIKDLFGEVDAGAAALMALENSLPIALANYDLCHDWMPEDSYCTTRLQVGRADQADNIMALSFSASACKRPLFLYPRPVLFSGGQAADAQSWRFLERIMTKWWRSDEQSQQRDYYQITGTDRRLLWVFKDLCGNWYTHGVFA